MAEQAESVRALVRGAHALAGEMGHGVVGSERVLVLAERSGLAGVAYLRPMFGRPGSDAPAD